MNMNGYILYGTTETLALALENLFYNNRGKSCLDTQIISSNDTDHKAHYHHVFSDKWDEFWIRWSQWRDLTDWHGQDRQLDIQEYCWSQLNLNKSFQTQVVEEFLSDNNDLWDDDVRDEDTYVPKSRRD